MRIREIFWVGIFLIAFNNANVAITTAEGEKEGHPHHSPPNTDTETPKPNEKSDSCFKLPKFANWLGSVFKSGFFNVQYILMIIVKK
jgi:hypothetical protein